jgi:hypothetical protein
VTTRTDIDARDTARRIRDRMPEAGLFAGHEWRIATRPFPLNANLVGELETLGRVLLQFYRAASLLHRRSLEGSQPAWVAEWLDRGKPESLLELQRHPALRNELPRVIRPDLLLTEEGFSITELDSVPGGIGLTGCLGEIYGREFGNGSVIGGSDGMTKGFESIFGDAPSVHLMVSDESSTYRPEMEWLAETIEPRRFQVVDSDFDGFHEGDAVYRFFELFDLPNVAAADALFAAATAGHIRLTPPPRPVLEEKMMLALLWNRNLHHYWHRELGEGFLRRLQRHVPYSWVIDDAPLPPHGAIPELNLTSWEQLKSLSQRERNLILKISGFSETAWGARGVSFGSDLSIPEWSAAVDHALSVCHQSPHILQRYHKPLSLEVEWFDFETETARLMNGRVRLCPYYFVEGPWDRARTRLGGVLATICPADKKIIHGMKDAILAPCGRLERPV